MKSEVRKHKSTVRRFAKILTDTNKKEDIGPRTPRNEAKVRAIFTSIFTPLTFSGNKYLRKLGEYELVRLSENWDEIADVIWATDES